MIKIYSSLKRLLDIDDHICFACRYAQACKENVAVVKCGTKEKWVFNTCSKCVPVNSVELNYRLKELEELEELEKK